MGIRQTYMLIIKGGLFVKPLQNNLINCIDYCFRLLVVLNSYDVIKEAFGSRGADFSHRNDFIMGIGQKCVNFRDGELFIINPVH